MCIVNAQKIKRTDRSKYKRAYKVITHRCLPILYYHKVSKPFNVEGKWNKVEFGDEEAKTNPDSAGFHFFLDYKKAELWKTLPDDVIFKCEIRGLKFIGVTGTRRIPTVIATQFRVVFQ